MGIYLGLRHLAVASVGTNPYSLKGTHVPTYADGMLLDVENWESQETRCNSQIKGKRRRSQSQDQPLDCQPCNGQRCWHHSYKDLVDIRNRAKSQKEAGRNLHSWAFYQLKEMICYKAEMAGIRFELVNSKYTRQTEWSCLQVQSLRVYLLCRFERGDQHRQSDFRSECLAYWSQVSRPCGCSLTAWDGLMTHS
jgi:transposase